MPSNPSWDDADYEDMIDFLISEPYNTTDTEDLHPTPNPFKGEGWSDEWEWEDDQ